MEQVDGQERAEIEMVLRAMPPPPAGNLEALRADFDGAGAPLPSDVEPRAVESGLLLVPPGADRARFVLYVHGGGFCLGSPRSHGGLGAEIARACGCAVLVVGYRRAPEHPYPAALEDVMEAAGWLSGSSGGADLFLMGDSAGAWLAVHAAARLARRPAGLVLLSPWLDLSLASASPREDPLITVEQLRAFAADFAAGAELPSVFEIDFDLGRASGSAGWPPTLIQVGEREILFGDAACLAKASGALLEEWGGAFHGWHLHFLRLGVARRAIARIGQFVTGLTSGASGRGARGHGASLPN
jgi:acetyl esterase/lipase